MTTLLKEEVQAEFNQRVLGLSNRLLNAQLVAAEGVTLLFKQEIDRKTGKRGKVERVTSVDEIQAFLDEHGEHGAGASGDGTAWYFIATERPNADAADRLLNRTLGKPKETVGLESNQPLAPQAVTYILMPQGGA